MKVKTLIIFSFLFVALLSLGTFTPVNGQVNKGPKYGNTPEDSAKCVKNISLYTEFYNQWKGSGKESETINDAIKYWRWIFFNCPRATENAYLNGMDMIKHFIKKAETEETKETKEKYIDTLMMIWDQRIEYFGNKGRNLGRKGVDYHQYRTSDYEGAYKILKESVKLTKNATEVAIIMYYFRLTAKMVSGELADRSLIIDTYDEVNQIIDYNLVKYKDRKSWFERWMSAKSNVEAVFTPFATCKDLVAIYTKKFEENKNDIALLKEITEVLDKRDCEESQLFMDATIQLYKLEPSPEAAYFIARVYLQEGNYTEAITYLNEATTLEDKDKLADIYYYLASCNYQLKKYSIARSNARKSLEYNPNNGQPYILIGDMYAQSAKSIGSNDLESKVAYWAAVDKYQQARRVDEEIKEVANKRIRDYSKYFPSMETIFFYDLKEGETYKVGGWINETTTVRPAPAQ